MKKILVVINNFGIGGAERLVVDDINEMIRRGYDVNVLTFKQEKKASLLDECRVSTDKLTFIEIRTIWEIRGWFNTFNYLKKINPDVVFSHLWFSNTIITPICRLVGIKNVITFEHNVYNSIKNKKMYFVDRLIQGLSKKIIAVSSAVKDSLIDHGIKEEKIIVINNGINLSKYKSERDFSYRQKLGIPENAFVFTTVGRLITQKGLDVLIKAFSRGLPEALLLIVGEGPKEAELKKLSESLHMSGKIFFLGSRRDVPKILEASNCFILASRWEGLGIVVLEAMASRLPIIISDLKAGEDMIQNGFNGIVVAKEDYVALHLQMKRLMEDPALQQYVSDNAYNKAKEFSIENHVNNIMSL